MVSNCCYFVPPTFFNTLNYSGSSVLFLKSKQTTNLIYGSFDSLVLVPVAVYIYLNNKVHSGSPFLHRKLLPRNSNLCNLIFIHALTKIIFLYMRNLQHGRLLLSPINRSFTFSPCHSRRHCFVCYPPPAQQSVQIVYSSSISGDPSIRVTLMVSFIKM